MDALDREAKARGTSREALIAFYMNRMKPAQNNIGQGTASKRPGVPPPAPVDQRGPLQRLMDALNGNPSGH